MGIIYLMTNNLNGLQYVGQTSLLLSARMAGHKHEAKILKPNVYFVRAMHKYGFENFSVKIIEECSDDKLDEREIFWIAEYDTYLGPGYNSTRGGKGNKKFLNSDILELWNSGYTRQEIADKINCHPATVTNGLRACGIPEEEVRKRGQTLVCKKKEVLQYDLNGKFIASYDSVDSAAEKINHHASSIRQVCNHHLHTAFGYIWCHADEQKTIQELINEIPKSKREKQVEQYNLEGKLINTYDSCAAASRKLNISACTIEQAARGELFSCAGFLWKYTEDETNINEKVQKNQNKKDYKKRKIDQYDLEGNFIISHNSAKEASLFINKEQGASSITKACRGKLKTAYGYKWSYAEA